jgi:hypothetical protein
MTLRESSHAGSWYDSSPRQLSDQLARFMDAATGVQPGRVRAIIAPHAGYSYSGATAAFAYKSVDTSGMCVCGCGCGCGVSCCCAARRRL